MSKKYININRLSNLSASLLKSELSSKQTVNKIYNDNEHANSSIDNITLNYEEKNGKRILISKGGELFRQKLINYFAYNDKNKQNTKPPTIYAHELALNEININRILLSDPDEKIRFSKYSKFNRSKLIKKKSAIHNLRYQLSKKSIKDTIKEYLKRTLTNKYFESLLLALLIVDAIVIGINVQLSVSNTNTTINNVDYKLTKNILFSIQVILTVTFLLESLLKLLIDYKGFFKSPWNVFDISLTIFTTLLEIMEYIYEHYFCKNDQNNHQYHFIRFLRVFRILRLLKVISHFVQLRIIVIALTKAIRSVMLISLLLFVFAYIFANIGLILFADMKNRTDDEYLNTCFSTINETLLTLFAIMTLDQWWTIFTTASESNDHHFITNVYFISWIILASFIFQNLFTGVMVNNFQEIRLDIERTIRKKVKERCDVYDKNLDKDDDLDDDYIFDDNNLHATNNCTLDSYSNESTNSTRSPSLTLIKSLSTIDQKLLNINCNKHLHTRNSFGENIGLEFENENRNKLNQVLDFMKKSRQKNQTWLKNSSGIDNMIESIKLKNEATYWPEDTLLYYYELMQSLVDNIQERMILFDYANQVLLLLHDKDNLLFPLDNYENAVKKNEE